MAETEMNVLGSPPAGGGLRQRTGYSRVQAEGKDSGGLLQDSFGGPIVAKDPTSGNSGGELLRENSGNKIFPRSTEKKTSKRRAPSSHYNVNKITYRGRNIYHAASQGDLPLCVLLWGMSSAKRVYIFVPDSEGNNPMHHAVLADTPEVVSFLLQQTKGQLEDGTSVLNSKNNYGETPLLRAVHMGQIPVIKLLIDEGSNPFETDSGGSTIFMVLCKQNHLWCLHFVFQLICTNHGIAAAMNLLSAVDNEFHTALDWAAYAGNLNIVEYLIRKGINPYRVDKSNRSPLYWTVKGHRYYTARLLVQCGCDPLALDNDNETPMSVAIAEGNSKMVKMLKTTPEIKKDASQLANVSSIVTEDTSFTPPLTCSTLSGRKTSNAIQVEKDTRWLYTMLYAFFMTIIWALAIPMPVYAWLLLVGTIVIIYRRYMKKAQKKFIAVKEDRAQLTFYEDLLICPERGVAMWCTGALMYSAYCVLSLLYQNGKGFYGYEWSPDEYKNPMKVAGISGDQYFFGLFWAFAWMLLACLFSWVLLMCFFTDPGVVDTRAQDFDEILALASLGTDTGTHRHYCKTTLVKKPYRSKFCSKLRVVIARMDHHCFWLNTAIGYGNHRAFILFLVTHVALLIVAAVLMIKILVVEIGWSSSCGVMNTLFGRKYFIITVTLVFTLAALCAMVALLVDQAVNICRNITTNERMNGDRYNWLKDDEGNFYNRYDRGKFINVLEFLGCPCYAIDYRSAFELPPVKHSGVSEAAGSIASSETSAGNPVFSGPVVNPPLTASNLKRKQYTVLQRSNLELGQRPPSDFGGSELTSTSDNSRPHLQYGLLQKENSMGSDLEMGGISGIHNRGNPSSSASTNSSDDAGGGGVAAAHPTGRVSMV